VTVVEPQQAGLDDRHTRLLAHLAPQGLFPGLAALAPASRQVPGLPVGADQHDLAARRHADPAGAVPLAFWRCGRWVPRRQPLPAGDLQGQLLTVGERKQFVHGSSFLQERRFR
jgi:hypothetical protein